jgi:hypothetical protein
VTLVRSGTPGDLLQVIARALEVQVAPTTADPRAHATLLLAAGLLDNLAQRVEEASALRAPRDEATARLTATMPVALIKALPAVRDSGGRNTLDRERRLTTGLAAVRDSKELQNSVSVQAWLGLCRDELVRRNAAELERIRPTRYLRSQY